MPRPNIGILTLLEDLEDETDAILTLRIKEDILSSPKVSWFFVYSTSANGTFKTNLPFHNFKLHRNIQSMSLSLSKINYQYFTNMLPRKPFLNAYDLVNVS